MMKYSEDELDKLNKRFEFLENVLANNEYNELRKIEEEDRLIKQLEYDGMPLWKKILHKLSG